MSDHVNDSRPARMEDIKRLDKRIDHWADAISERVNVDAKKTHERLAKLEKTLEHLTLYFGSWGNERLTKLESRVESHSATLAHMTIEKKEQAETGSTEGRARTAGSSVRSERTEMTGSTPEPSQAGIKSGPVSALCLVDVEAVVEEWGDCKDMLRDTIRSHSKPVDAVGVGGAIESALRQHGYRPPTKAIAHASRWAIEELARQMNTDAGSAGRTRSDNVAESIAGQPTKAAQPAPRGVDVVGEDSAASRQVAPASATTPREWTEEQEHAAVVLLNQYVAADPFDGQVAAWCAAISKVAHLFVEPRPAVTDAMGIGPGEGYVLVEKGELERLQGSHGEACRESERRWRQEAHAAERERDALRCELESLRARCNDYAELVKDKQTLMTGMTVLREELDHFTEVSKMTEELLVDQRDAARRELAVIHATIYGPLQAECDALRATLGETNEALVACQSEGGGWKRKAEELRAEVEALKAKHPQPAIGEEGLAGAIFAAVYIEIELRDDGTGLPVLTAAAREALRG